MRIEQIKNYAFIDSQNINLGIKSLGWRLDWKRFRVYLKEKYQVGKAYLFIGYLPENQDLYTSLQSFGYLLVFKPVLKTKDGEVKGNVDADLVLQAMIEYEKYDKAVIVTSDGDFYSLVDYLNKQGKLVAVLSPREDRCSVLLKKTGKEKMRFMHELKRKLSYSK